MFLNITIFNFLYPDQGYDIEGQILKRLVAEIAFDPVHDGCQNIAGLNAGGEESVAGTISTSGRCPPRTDSCDMARNQRIVGTLTTRNTGISPFTSTVYCLEVFYQHGQTIIL